MTVIDSYARFAWWDFNQIKVMHFVHCYKPVPKLWPSESILDTKMNPILRAAVQSYFNAVDDFIKEQKVLGHLPMNFLYVSELKGKPRKTNDMDKKTLD